MAKATRYQIAPAVIDQMRGNIRVESALMQYFNVSAKTVRNWINYNNALLTVPGCTQLISELLTIPHDQIIIISSQVWY